MPSLHINLENPIQLLTKFQNNRSGCPNGHKHMIVYSDVTMA